MILILLIMVFLRYIVAVLFLAVNAACIQQGFNFKSDGFNSNYQRPFTPFKDVHALPTTDFTVLEHPLFPHYGVRIKESNFCDTTVKSYTGYIDIEARHLFFYFFESRSNPDDDDVIFWANGGPGCSSSTGLFLELGPCRVTGPDNLTFNPYSWNEKANVFFIDQPVGVGFSYAEYGEYVSTTEEAAQDVAAFVTIFFEHFTKFKGRAFHMAGESYAGRYIPAFASYIHDQNAKLVSAGVAPINLKSIMIGNGCSDDSTMYPSYYDMQCKRTSAGPPVQKISTCVAMKKALPRCQKWLQESCFDTTDNIGCAAALSFCSFTVELPFYETGMNPFDITKPCEGSIQDSSCYSDHKAVASYLNKPAVRRTIGVDERFSNCNFMSCNKDVASRFDKTLDEVFPSTHQIAALLERGVRVLLYIGANDWMCNWIGNKNMVDSLDWTGKGTFRAAGSREWKVDGEVAGLVRSGGGLTFVTLDGAGHLVPYDKPKESLQLIQRWLSNEEI
ncbi:serine carboxypeptidase [Irpex lacteus]|nr:serine carboxypeptidase [Irpex lacteus]